MRYCLRFLLKAAAACLCLLAGGAGADEHCTYSEVGHLPLFYSGPSLEITTGGQINGEPATMLVDTGAFASFVTRTGTERHGLRLLGSGGDYVIGVGGDSELYSAPVRDLAIGPFHTGKTRMQVIAATGYTPSYDAIIGADFLTQVDLEISLVDKQLKFFSGSGCGDAFLGYWKSGAIEVPLMPAYHHGLTPHLKVRINGQELEAEIDSGSGTSWIALAAARRAGLRLDSPKVKRLGDTHGVGASSIPQWRAVFDSFEIGTERISNPELSVVDTNNDDRTEVLLGADFLRAHRVLFAISQSKLYLAYVGGTPFSVRSKLEPWMEQEAQAGNADAQYAVGRAYLEGDGAARDTDKGNAWMARAVAQGSPYANSYTGKLLLQGSRYAEAAQRFRAALDKLPSDRDTALLLFLARQQAGDAETARKELTAAFAASDGAWPTPLADFYLGRIDEAALLSAASKDEALARGRICSARSYIAQLHQVRGDKAESDAAQAPAKECDAPTGKPKA